MGETRESQDAGGLKAIDLKEFIATYQYDRERKRLDYQSIFFSQYRIEVYPKREKQYSSKLLRSIFISNWEILRNS